jgi:hypothetical protein
MNSSPSRALMLNLSVRLSYAAFALFLVPAVAQLRAPSIDTTGVGWGWFMLHLRNADPSIIATRWTIISGASGDTLLDKSCSHCSASQEPCPGEFYADDADLLSKEIIGCAPDADFIVKARYNDGVQWSAWTPELRFHTPAEPGFPGDTATVILWGHSFASYGPDCATYGDIRLGNDFSNISDNFGHILQTLLRRTLRQPIVVLNNAIAGSTQYDWIHSNDDPVSGEYKYGPDSLIYQHFDTTYAPGGSYANRARYPIAVFFIGDNDAAVQYPDSLFAIDTRRVLNTLSGYGVRVIYNSIHYTTAPDYSDREREDAYYAAWQRVMDEFAPNPNVWKGVDYYTIFERDTLRFLGLDGIHPDFSEALVPIAKVVMPLVLQALIGPRNDVAAPGLPSIPRCSISPNPFSTNVSMVLDLPCASHVRVQCTDVLGRSTTVYEGDVAAGSSTVPCTVGMAAHGAYLFSLDVHGTRVDHAVVVKE